MNVAASPPPFCTPAANSMCEWVESVEIADLYNPSGNDGGYGNYLGLGANLQIGNTYSITLTPGTSSENPFCTSGGGTFDEYWQIWIDLNQDGTLDETAELVYDSGAAIAGTVNDSIQVPETAQPGSTLMRIGMNWAMATYPCNTFGYGEFEDYTLNLAAPCDADAEPPTASCKNHVVFLNATGNASITPGDVNNGSTDNCSIAGLAVTPDVFDCWSVGPNTVVLTVTDESGNTASSSATVTVEDDMPPMAVCQDLSVALDESGVATIAGPDVDAGSYDNCGIANLAVAPDVFDCWSVGPNTVVLTVTDENGNTADCSATVTVVDDMPPMAVCQDLSVALDESGVATITEPDVAAGSYDNCAFIDWYVYPNSFNSAGTYTAILEVFDMAGNMAMCEATVTVEDAGPCPSTADLSYTLNGQVADFGILLTPAADSVEVYWDFGDGTAQLTSTPSVTHTFPQDGEDYMVTAFVTAFYDGVECLNTLEDTISVPFCPGINLLPTDSTFTENEMCYDVFLEGLPGSIYIVDVQTNNGYGNPTASVSTAQDGDTITVCLNEYFPPGTELILTVVDITASSLGLSYKVFQTISCSSSSIIFHPISGIISAGITEIDIDDDLRAYVGCQGQLLIIGPNPDLSNCSPKQKYYYLTDEGGKILHKCDIRSKENSRLFTGIETGLYKIYYVEICGNGKSSGHKGDNISSVLGQSGVSSTHKQLHVYNKKKCGDYAACCMGDPNSAEAEIGFRPENETEAAIDSAMNYPDILWSTGDTTFNISAPTPGTYSVTIIHPGGDTLSHEFIVHASPKMEIWGHAFPTGDSLGVTAAGGTPPYQYGWSNEDTSRIVHGIPATDSLYVTVTDALGCSQTAGPISHANPCSLSPIFGYVPANMAESCLASGSIYYCAHTINLTGGAPPNNLDWETTGYVRYSQATSEGGTTIIILYAQNAEWSLSVTDNNNCGNFGSGPLIFSNLPDTCGATQYTALNIYDHTVSHVSSAGNDGSISISVEGGDPPYLFEWTSTISGWLPPPPSPANLSVDGGNDNGYLLGNLAPGWYIVTVTDAAGSTDMATYWMPSGGGGTTSGGFSRNKQELSPPLLLAYPNPVKGRGNLLFNTPTSGNCELVLYNMLGSKTATLFEGHVEAGKTQNVFFGTKDLFTGTYLCVLSVDGETRTHVKIVVLP